MNKLFIVAVFLLTGCATVRPSVTQIATGEYLISCDGNGYSSQNDTIQCIAKQSVEACAAEGKGFKIKSGNSNTAQHVGVNLMNGTPVYSMRPHSVADVLCTGEPVQNRVVSSVKN